jgi:ATP-binding cassette subfamily B protein
MKNKEQSLSVIRAYKRIIPIIFKGLPVTTILFILICLAAGVITGLTAPFNQRLYDALANLAGGTGFITAVYIGAAFVAGRFLLQQVFYDLYGFILREIFFKKVEGVTGRLINNKMEKLSAEVFEDKDRLDDINKAAEGGWRCVFLFSTFMDIFLFFGMSLVVLGIYLWSLRPVLILAMLFAFIPSFLSQLIEAKMWAKLENESAPERRRFNHYEDCLVGTGKLKETRLFGAFAFFRTLYMNTLTLLQEKEWGVAKKTAAITLGLNLIKSLGWVGILYLLFNSFINGYISVGAFAAVFTSLGMMFDTFDYILEEIRGGITQYLGHIHNFINLMDMEETGGETATPDFKRGIQAIDASFSYPKTGTLSVDNINLHIKPGETIAIVGENGSGKTTLVKMLMGLYKPTKGQILIGNRDSATTQESSLFSNTSAVFQNFIQYIFSLAENVYLSDYEKEKPHDVTKVLTDASVDYENNDTYPQGLNTILSREYGGTDISGGQMQRIAMARGMYRRHQFIVLDEPTAAIDPLEETRIYQQFATYSKNKTAVLVTHRLGSARIADKILVMDGGKISEWGTHDELRKANGKYAEMWEAQAERYR